MKFLLLPLLLAGPPAASAQTRPAVARIQAAPDSTQKIMVVEAACGQCRLGLPGKSCDLAVRLPDGRAYFVDGTTIDSHGDAHAQDGFCQAIRRARVQGRLVDNRFQATYFQLLPAPAAGK